MTPLRRTAAVATICLALAACQASPTEPSRAAASLVSLDDAIREAMAAHDCARAAPLLRQVLTGNPASITAHYDLAVCATYADATADAEREFQWVVLHAPPESVESQLARDWLRERSATSASAAAADTADRAKGDSQLSGRAIWADPGETPKPFQLRLYLIGLPDTPTQGLFYQVRPDPDGRYEFTDVPAGVYRLTDRPGGRPLWRRRVTLEPGKKTTIDLSPDDGVASRDDFPENSS
jgi:hypothetical protein